MGKPALNKKNKAEVCTPEKWSSIDSNPLEFLLSPQVPEEFTRNHWEQQPLHIPSTATRRTVFRRLFDLDSLLALAAVQENKPKGALRFGLDVNAARYTAGVRETRNEKVADRATLSQLLQEGCTLQLHQPQRWVPDLWRLIAALERQLGCLVGSNVYATPAGFQGLAPHYDDVEIFVCHTQGSKTWRLYSPVNLEILPSEPSADLARDQLGKPTMTVTLQEGDVLYLPRGTVHEAVATEGPSVHITISTAQRCSLATLLAHLLGGADTAALPLQLRYSLPLGFVYNCGTFTASDADAVTSMGAKLGAGLRALADELEAKPSALLPAATDAFSMDFMASRAPPHPAHLLSQGHMPEFKDSVFCRDPAYFRIVHMDHAAPGKSDIKVMSSLDNPLEQHMMGAARGADCADSDCEDEACGAHHADTHNGHHPTAGAQIKEHESGDEDDEEGNEEEEDDDEDDEASRSDMVLPASHTAAVRQLLESTAAAPVAVKDVLLPSKAEQLHLVRFLWEGGVLCTTTSKTSIPKVKGAARGTRVMKGKAANGKRKGDDGEKRSSKRSG